MVREIYLATGLYDNKVATLTDNEDLQIRLVGAVMSNLTYILKAKFNGKQHAIKFVNNLITIERKNLCYGKFQAKIVAVANENIVKEFNLEDLLLKEIDGELKVIPELEQVKSEFAEIKVENEQLRNKVAELEELCENTKELVLELNGISQKVGA